MPKRSQPISRRQALRYLAGASATAFAGPSLSTASATNPPVTLPPPKDSGIEHIIVLMMENRSFDHFIGWLPGADGKQSGLSYIDRSGLSHPTYALAPDYQGCDHPDPDHSYQGGRSASNNGGCDGWLRTGSNDLYSIGYYQEDDLPFMAASCARMDGL
jgi:phospholipase C